jgi:hypothetical protein
MFLYLRRKKKWLLLKKGRWGEKEYNGRDTTDVENGDGMLRSCL